MKEGVEGKTELDLGPKGRVTPDPTNANACLVHVYPPGPELGKRYPLEGICVIGREASCTIHIDSKTVSREHARVFREANAWIVEDGDGRSARSTNGTIVNNETIDRATLRDGDHIKIGAVIFKFLAGSGIEASYFEEIYKMTIQDPLTGVHNRRYFDEHLALEVRISTRHHRPLALIRFGIDGFDSLVADNGLLAGDHVLREVCTRLAGKIHAGELLARLEKEEFAILLPEIELPAARTLAEELRALVAGAPFPYRSEDIAVTISLGVAAYTGEGDTTPAKLYVAADKERLRAKREGRDRVCAGDRQAVEPWPSDQRSALRGSQPTDAVVAISFANRRVMMARPGGAAQLDDLEGLLAIELRALAGNRISLGRLADDSTLIVIVKPPGPAQLVELLAARAPTRLVAAIAQRGLPEAMPVFGAPSFVGSDPQGAIARAAASLSKQLADVERGQLPLPIEIAARATRAHTTKLAIAMALISVFESTLRWLVVATVSELGRESEAAKELRAAISRKVTLGVWVSILRRAANELAHKDTAHAQIWKSLFGNKLVDLMSSFVEDRNVLGHGGTADERTAPAVVERWFPALETLLGDTLKPLSHLVPYEIVEVDFDTEDAFDYRVRKLVGDHDIVPITSLSSQRRMKRGTLQLFDVRRDRALALDPLAIYELCGKCGAHEIFVIDHLTDRGVVYANPASGHTIVADARRSAVEKFFTG